MADDKRSASEILSGSSLDLEKLRNLKKEQVDIILKLKDRIALGAFALRHMDMFHIYREIFKDTQQELTSIDSLIKNKAKRLDLSKLDNEEKTLIKKALELDGEVDSQFAIMVGTLIFILRVIENYYANKAEISKILFPKEYEAKFEKLLSEDKMFRFIENATKFNPSLVGEGSQGALVHLADTIMTLAEAEGAGDKILERRRLLKKLFGTSMKKLTEERLDEISKDAASASA